MSKRIAVVLVAIGLLAFACSSASDRTPPDGGTDGGNGGISDAGNSDGGDAGPRIYPSNLEWPEDTAELVAHPRLGQQAYGYESSISSFNLAPITVGGVPYIYAVFRVKADGQDMLRMAYVRADQFSSRDPADGQLHVKPIETWTWIPASAFGVEPAAGNIGIPSGHPVALGSDLLISYALKDINDEAPQAMLFDPDAGEPVWCGLLSDGTGYEGPTTNKNTSLARITLGGIDGGDYFDGSQGHVLLAYTCSQKTGDPSKCVLDRPGERDYYIQEVMPRAIPASALGCPHPDGGPAPFVFGPAIRVFQDAFGPDDPVEPDAGKPFWRKQNFMVNNLANDTALLSVAYNAITPETIANRPPDRDYPTYESFFEMPHVSQLLSEATRSVDAGVSTSVDLAGDMIPETQWKQDMTAETLWDQGAFWNQSVYQDPFEGGAIFTTYESWGADFMQPARTRNALYPGSIREWVTAADSSCNDFCVQRDANGNGCLSASAVKPAGLRGEELPHDVAMADAGANRALYVCSDLGTRNPDAGADDFETVRFTTDGAPTVQDLRDACTQAGYPGFIWAEQADGYALRLPGDGVPANQPLVLHCSTEFDSSQFFAVQLTDRNTSCDMACDIPDGGTLGYGFRPYLSEVRALTADGGRQLLDGVEVDPGFVLSMQGYWTAGDDAPSWWTYQSGPGNVESLDCVCGPGREMRASMTSRLGVRP